MTTPDHSRGLQPEAGALPFALRLAVFYAAIFIVYGVQVPFLPVWLTGRGLDESQVALITAAPFLLRLAITPAVAMIADRSGSHRRAIIALAWFGLAAVLALGPMRGFTGILSVSVLFLITAATIMPLTETIAVRGVSRHGLDYGRLRLWGSISFVVIGLAGGALIDRAGAEATLALLIAGAAATVAAAHGLPRDPVLPENEMPAVRTPLLTAEIRRLIRAPVFIAFLIAASATQAAHAMFYTFGALHLHALGVSSSWVGALWAIGVTAEVLLFAFAGSRLRSVSPLALLLAGAMAAALRWTVMSFDPALPLLVVLQTLHALTYGATHLGAIAFIAQAAPERAAGTAQALYATFAAGVVMGIAIMASGSLYKSFGGMAYLGMTVLSLISLAACLYIARRWNGERL